MKPEIRIFKFVERQDSLDDILGMLSPSFVRHYGSLQTKDGEFFIEVVGSSQKPFTESQLKAAVAADFEMVNEEWANITDEAIAEFLK